MPPDSSAEAMRIVTDPDLHLLADGRRIEPLRQPAGFVFRLDQPCRDLVLASRASRPIDVGINTGDVRLLGVRLVGLSLLRDGAHTPIPLDHPALLDGLHELEPTGIRWTNGAARLPVELLGGGAGPVELHVAASALQGYRAGTAAQSALMARFASLGDDCEFGFLQRAYDAEPLDLLRWAGTDAARLTLGLVRRFEGLGDPAHTRLEFDDEPPEYKLRDRRYLGMHTWIGDRQDDPAKLEEMRLAGCARLRLMRRKLLAEATEGRRIFVFKQTQAAARRDSLFAVHAALRSLGPAPLLCVLLTEDPARVGEVDALGNGLYLGHIDMFDRRRISFAAWMRICTTTAALVDAAAQGTSP